MAQELWRIDSGHSGIHFSVRHMLISKVRGQFSRWTGTLCAEDGLPERATVEAIIDASSIETGVADRDAHLRSADFLGTEDHPEITFVSSGVEKGETDLLRVDGDLTIRGLTRPVTLEVRETGRTKDPWGNERVGFTARASIDRKDYGLTWNQFLEAGGAVVGDRIDVEIEIEAVKQAAANVA